MNAHLDEVQFIREKPKEVIEKLKSMLASGEIKQRDIVDYSEYSPGVISSFFKGNYSGDVEAIQDVMLRYYRKWVVEKKISKNSFLNKMENYLTLAYRKKLMGKITAPFGAGKSVATAHFAATNPDTSAYVELRSTTSRATLTNAIGDAIGIQLSGSIDDRLARLIREVTRSAKLFIIDESDNLNPRTLAVLKDIYGNKSAQRCGIVLVGTEKLDEIMKSPQLGYLRSRISFDVRLETIDFDEAHEIADLYQHDLTKKELQEAWLWASQNHGGLRGFTNLLELADIFAEGKKEKIITSDSLLSAYAMADKDLQKAGKKK